MGPPLWLDLVGILMGVYVVVFRKAALRQGLWLDTRILKREYSRGTMKFFEFLIVFIGLAFICFGIVGLVTRLI